MFEEIHKYFSHKNIIVTQLFRMKFYFVKINLNESIISIIRKGQTFLIHSKIIKNLFCYVNVVLPYCFSILTFWELGVLGDLSVLIVCPKNGVFKSCFQQNAKVKMTAQTKSNTLCNENQTLYLDLQLESRFSNSPPLCVFSLSDLFMAKKVSLICTRDRID